MHRVQGMRYEGVRFATQINGLGPDRLGTSFGLKINYVRIIITRNINKNLV